MEVAKVGINGFGRIGRYVARMILHRSDIEVVAVNDLSDIQTIAHLFKYDSIHGKLDINFHIEDNTLVFDNGKRIVVTAQKDPALIPWSDFGADYILESTGIFRSREKAAAHLEGGAKRVIISAPPNGKDVKSVVMGINENIIEDSDIVISNASCTTNCAAPMIKVIRDLCNIQSVYISTVHSYTSDQNLHDSPHKDLRRARAAAESIVPTSTGAAKAISVIFPELSGKMGGVGIRVPVPNGSLCDLTFFVDKAPSSEAINQAFKDAASGTLNGILDYTDEPLVSRDIIGNPNSCIFDSQLTEVIDEKMIKIVGWYDNEAGYSNRCVDLILELHK